MTQHESTVVRQEAGGRDSALSRAGRIDLLIAKILVIVIAAVAVGVQLGTRVWDWLWGHPLTWQAATGRETPQVSGISTGQGISVRYRQDAVWSQLHAPTGRWVISLVPEVLQTAIIVVAATFLLKLITKIRSGDPFDRHSVGMVAWLAGLILGFGTLVPMARLCVAAILTMSAQDVPSYEFQIPASALASLLPACAVVVLSYAWRAGNRLRSDTDGLV